MLIISDDGLDLFIRVDRHHLILLYLLLTLVEITFNESQDLHCSLDDIIDLCYFSCEVCPICSESILFASLSNP